MQKIILTILISLTISNSVFLQETIHQPKLKLVIDSIYQIDQQVQQDFMEAIQRQVSSDSISFYEKKEFQTFERHIPFIKNIVKKNGFPTFEKVGKESSTRFFILIQHSDKDVKFQEKMLPLIKKQVDKKQAKGSNYAYLFDRIQINNGKEQLYGTQLGYDNEGNPFSKNLKDKENVNKRRAEFDMETLEEYLAMATEMHKKQNQK
jgi:hypothetical protein